MKENKKKKTKENQKDKKETKEKQRQHKKKTKNPVKQRKTKDFYSNGSAHDRCRTGDAGLYLPIGKI